MSDARPSTRSPLEIGVAITLAGLGVAAVVGFIAVFDAGDVTSGFGTGFGISLAILLAGGTLACALACLARGRAELAALGGIVAASLAMDLLVLAVWLDIDDEGYGKLTGLAFVWSFFALVALALMLAVGHPASPLARGMYLGALMATVWGAVVSTALVLSAGDAGVVGGASVPFAGAADDELLRLLGAFLVLNAALWFGALASSRLERPPSPDA
jgi:hypothetical protein